MGHDHGVKRWFGCCITRYISRNAQPELLIELALMLFESGNCERKGRKANDETDGGGGRKVTRQRQTDVLNFNSVQG